MHRFYYTIGEYDLVALVEWPSNEAALSLLFALGIGGWIRTTTLKAFTVEEIERVTEKILTLEKTA